MWKMFLMSCIMMLSVSGVALAHFGMVIPYPSYGNAGYAAGQAESGAGHCEWQD